MKNKKYLIIILILAISIGFAYLSTNLNINLTANIDPSKWDIHFENVALTSESVEGTLPTIDSDKTTINFTANLNKPGDKYEFTVDVVNAGTIDAFVNNYDCSGLILRPYLEIDYTYLSGLELEQNDLLSAGSRETILVSVTFKKNITANQLPTEDTNGIEGTIEITYVPTKSFPYRTPIDINKPVTVIFHKNEEIYFADQYGNELDTDTVTVNIKNNYSDYSEFIDDFNTQLGNVKSFHTYDSSFMPNCGTNESIVFKSYSYSDTYLTFLDLGGYVYYNSNGNKVLYNNYIQKLKKFGREDVIDLYPEHEMVTMLCA